MCPSALKVDPQPPSGGYFVAAGEPDALGLKAIQDRVRGKAGGVVVAIHPPASINLKLKRRREQA